MKRPIGFWHGYDDKLAQKLETIPGVTRLRPWKGKGDWAGWGHFEFDGSLDVFVEQAGVPVMITKEYIAITQYRNFGQR